MSDRAASVKHPQRKSTDARAAVRWRPGDVAMHSLAEGLVLKVEAVTDSEHVKARVLRKGETGLWEGNVLTFRTEYLTPAAG